MGFSITGTIFWAECECPKCGHSFSYEDEGNEYIGDMYRLDEVLCPNCNTWFNSEDEAEDFDDDDE